MPFQVGDIVTPRLGLDPWVYSQKNVSCIRGAFYKVLQLSPLKLEFYAIPDNAIVVNYNVAYFRERYVGSIWSGLQSEWYTKGSPSKNNLSIFR